MKPRKSRRTVNNSSGRRKNNGLNLVDRISALPDSILGPILSFLPTKDAVATAFISKRWRYLWRTVHNLEFSHEGGYNTDLAEGEDMGFVQFVNHVLLFHDAGSLNKFRLTWNPYCISSSHVDSWINTAITRNIYELCLCCFLSDSHVPYELPASVFRCDSLRSLELNGIYVPAVDGVCLPRLESLKLIYFCFQCEEDFEKLISKCPMLNYLHLNLQTSFLLDFVFDAEFTYIISSTSLKHLELFINYELPEGNVNNDLKLEASSLEYLQLKGSIYGISVQKRLSSLVEAEFVIDLLESDFSQANVCNVLVEAVRVFECAKALKLSGDAMWALSCATIRLSTHFQRLVKLEIRSYCCYTSSLQEIIQSSDILELLIVNKEPSGDGKTYLHDHSNWTAPAEVPRCLSISLKEVTVNGYSGFEDEQEMICYILKHGSALQVMKISVYKSMDNAKFNLLQEIRKFPRKSPACEIDFVVRNR